MRSDGVERESVQVGEEPEREAPVPESAPRRVGVEQGDLPGDPATVEGVEPEPPVADPEGTRRGAEDGVERE